MCVCLLKKIFSKHLFKALYKDLKFAMKMINNVFLFFYYLGQVKIWMFVSTVYLFILLENKN